MGAGPRSCAVEDDIQKIIDVIELDGMPGAGVINGATGEVIEEQAYKKMSLENYEEWLSKVWIIGNSILKCFQDI